MKRILARGSTSVITHIFIPDSASTTGGGKTGLTNASAGLVLAYIRPGEAAPTVYTQAASNIETITTIGTYQAPTASKIRFKEIDATNMPGWYEVHAADSVYNATNTRRSVGFTAYGASGMAPTHWETQLTAVDLEDSVRGGLTALPPAAAGATGGLSCTTVFGGTASAGSATTITLAGASAVDNIYNHMHVRILSGTGTGQERTIAAYNGTTKVATVGRNWTTNPDNTSVIEVSGPEGMPAWNLFQGVASAGGATTVTLSGGSATSSIYNGALIAIMAGTGARQARVITGYNGGTGVVTVDRAWQTNPDSTSVVVILAGDLPGADGAGNLSGSVGSVTGAVGSVTGAVTVGTINNNVITANSIATDAITAAKIATDAIGAAELASDAVTEIQAGMATSAAQVSMSFAIAAIQADTDDIQTRLPAALVSGRMDSSVGAIATGAIVSGSFAVDSITSGALSNGACDEIADHVWDELLSGHVISGSAGETLAAAGSSGDPWSTLVPGAYGAGTAGKILGDNLDAAISTRATPAQVNTEVVDALATDTYAEPSAVPAATATLAEKIGWIMALARNKITQTATTQILRNSTDSATIGTSTDSDDGTVFTRGGFV